MSRSKFCCNLSMAAVWMAPSIQISVSWCDFKLHIIDSIAVFISPRNRKRASTKTAFRVCWLWTLSKTQTKTKNLSITWRLTPFVFEQKKKYHVPSQIHIHSVYHYTSSQNAWRLLLCLKQYGGFLKWWYPTTMGFPTKNDHSGVFWGYPHLRKHPYVCNYMQILKWYCTYYTVPAKYIHLSLKKQRPLTPPKV